MWSPCVRWETAPASSRPCRSRRPTIWSRPQRSIPAGNWPRRVRSIRSTAASLPSKMRRSCVRSGSTATASGSTSTRRSATSTGRTISSTDSSSRSGIPGMLPTASPSGGCVWASTRCREPRENAIWTRPGRYTPGRLRAGLRASRAVWPSDWQPAQRWSIMSIRSIPTTHRPCCSRSCSPRGAAAIPRASSTASAERTVSASPSRPRSGSIG